MNLFLHSIILCLLLLFSCSTYKNEINYNTPDTSLIKKESNSLKEDKIIPFEKTTHCQYKDQFVYQFENVETKPVMTKHIPPHYPESARKSQIQGTVVIAVIINENGDVIKTTILKSIPLLDKPAMIAARQCKFEPAQVDGKPVKVCMNIPFNFRLS